MCLREISYGLRIFLEISMGLQTPFKFEGISQGVRGGFHESFIGFREIQGKNPHENPSIFLKPFKIP